MLSRIFATQLRQLRKSPGFTLTAVLTLALGIGANTAIFTVVYATLLAPMPYPQPDQLVMVWSKIQGDRNSIAAQDFVDWKNQNTVFQDLNAFTGGSFNLATKDQPEYLEGQFTTPGYVSHAWASSFCYGRDFLPEEGTAGQGPCRHSDEQALEAPGLRSQHCRQDHPDRRNRLYGCRCHGARPARPPRPVADRAAGLQARQLNHDFHWLLAMGRLKPGVTIKQAQANMDAVTANIAKAIPEEQQGMGRVCRAAEERLPAQGTNPDPVDAARRGRLCAADCLRQCRQPAARQRHHAAKRNCRAHLPGASRRDIFAQFLTENLAAGLIGGLLGVGVGRGSACAASLPSCRGARFLLRPISRLICPFCSSRLPRQRSPACSLAARRHGTPRASIRAKPSKRAAAPEPARAASACAGSWSSANSRWLLRCSPARASPFTASGISPASISASTPSCADILAAGSGCAA